MIELSDEKLLEVRREKKNLESLQLGFRDIRFGECEVQGLKVVGILENATKGGGKYITLSGHLGDRPWKLEYVHAQFKFSACEQLKHINKGDSVDVRGTLYIDEHRYATLVNCELLS